MILGVTTAPRAETLQVTKRDNGKTIHVRPGDVIEVGLDQLGAAGYAWEIQDLDGRHFSVLSEATGEPPSAGDFVGGPALRTWRIQAKREGSSEIRFLHYRIWEGRENALDTFVLKVRIQKH
jgi:predicted secreted protein